jgi:hypothetical protein
MTTAYTSLLGLALPVTGELSGTWGDTVNTAITSLLDTAIAGTTSITTDADITLSTTTGASNQARQAIILWNPASGTTTRNITAPAQSKIYTVINASGGTQSIVIRGAGPTTGVTIVKGESATVAWNGSDFVKVSTSGGGLSLTDLTVTGNTTLGDAAADTLTVNATSTFNAPVSFAGLVRLPSTGRSAAAALTVTAPAFLYGVASTYTDTTSSGTIAAMAPFYSVAQPTLSTSNVTTYTNAATLYIANAPAAGGSATITNPYALYSAAGANYFGGNATFASNVTLGDASGDTLTINGTAVSIPNNLAFAGSFLYLNSATTRIGVNTATPSEVFDVYNGRIQNSGNNATAFDVYQTYASAFPTNEKYWRTQVYTDGTVGTTQSRFQFINDAYSAASTWMTVRRDGIALLGVVFNEDSNDADFRIESDGNTHAFFLDGGVGTVNINSSVGSRPSGGNGISLQIGVVSSASQIYHYGTTADKGFITGTTSDNYIMYEGPSSGVFNNRLEIVNGGELVINQISLDRDTRIETTGRPYAFFVDASANTIGINNSTPVGDLDVSGSTGVYLARSGGTGSDGRVLYLKQFNDYGYSFNIDSSSTGKLFIKAVNAGVESSLIEWDRTGIAQFNYGSAVFNEGSGDYDFRVESDGNTHMLFVDAGSNAVGIGTSATTNGWGSSYIPLYVGSGGLRLASTGAASTFSQIVHSGYYDGSNWIQSFTDVTVSRIEFTGGSGGSAQNFYTANNVAAGNAVTSIRNLALTPSASVFNEDSLDQDFRVESDGNTHCLFVDAGNNKVAINSASVFAGAALNVYNGGILNYTEYALSGTTPVALSQTMTGGLYVMRDDLNGGTCLVLYENGGTPIIVSQSSVGNYITGTPSGTQVKLSANGSDGIAASMASGQTTTLRVMALICDPN